jgi:hypothetical protein
MDETVINGKSDQIVMLRYVYMNLFSFMKISETSSIVRLKILEHQRKGLP